MCRLFETIKIKDRVAQNLEYHTKRMNDSRSALLGATGIIDLSEHISVPISLGKGIYKCRVIYGEVIDSIEFTPYQVRPVSRLRIVEDDTIQYDHKYTDRTRLDDLLQGCQADDILIIKNGVVTDTSVANILFYDGTGWITPSTPLLRGTKREFLLRRGFITERRISKKELGDFEKATLINAMIDLGEGPVIDVSNILG